MKTMILRANQHKQMIWKNGGGITHEIDREPNNNQDEFHWRLSMASVKFPGDPFSIYPNIDRTLCIIDGQNLTLKFNNNNNHELVHLNKDSSPYSFPGEISITCQIYEDTITDFNVMTKRDKFRHIVQRFILRKDQKPMKISNDNQDILFIVVSQGNLEINGITMTKGDAIKFIDNNQIKQISNSIDNTIIYLVKIIKILS
jgi:environmental stress-induced protein Ves